MFNCLVIVVVLPLQNSTLEHCC